MPIVDPWIVGYYAQLWWLDALGGLLLSLFVIMNWAETSAQHIRNLTGAAATADERNVLLYLTMRFAKTVKHIQGLSAYHSGDKLNVEVDIVLDESTSLRDSHDLGESLQYVLESVPNVDRAWVHMDYCKILVSVYGVCWLTNPQCPIICRHIWNNNPMFEHEPYVRR